MFARAVAGVRRLSLKRVAIAGAMLVVFSFIYVVSGGFGTEAAQATTAYTSAQNLIMLAWFIVLIVGGWLLGLVGGALLGAVLTILWVPLAYAVGIDGLAMMMRPVGLLTLVFDVLLGALPGALADSYHESRLRTEELARKNRELEATSRALAQSEAMFRQFADSVQVGVWIAPARGQLYVNPALKRLWQMDSSGPAADWEKKIHPDDLPLVRQNNDRAKHGLTVEMEYRIRHDDGQIRWCHGTTIPVATVDGASTYVGVVEDITAAKDREQRRELIERRERLLALGTLVAGVAHEVNNPLTYLMGNMELARTELALGAATDPHAAKADRLLATSVEGAERIARIVKALRAVTRTSSEGERGAVRLNAIATNVHELMRTSVPPRVKIALELSRDDPVVEGNSSEIYQVILNLATNAVQAIGDRAGHIVVGTTTSGGEASLFVRDDGPGISPEARKRLFTPFYTTKPEGTGLGLSLAHAIIHDHGGDIDVESRPGEGALFRVRMPRMARAVEVAA